MEGRLLLRVPEAARAIGLSRSKTYELIHEGVIPTIKIGRSVRISLKELERWVDDQIARTRTQED